jgi:putative SOS response-associated peptidase YedK
LDYTAPTPPSRDYFWSGGRKLRKIVYRKRRCMVSMSSIFQRDPKGKRYAISRRNGEPFGVAGIWENCGRAVMRSLRMRLRRKP